MLDYVHKFLYHIITSRNAGSRHRDIAIGCETDYKTKKIYREEIASGQLIKTLTARSLPPLHRRRRTRIEVLHSTYYLMRNSREL